MRITRTVTLLLLCLAMAESRLEQILGLLPEETRSIAVGVHAEIPGTLAKYLKPKEINHTIQVKSDEDLSTFDAADLQKIIQERLDEEQITLNVSDILAKRIIDEYLQNSNDGPATIVKVEGQYIEDGSTEWSDVFYYVYGDVRVDTSQNPLNGYLQRILEICRPYLPDYISLYIESFFGTNHRYNFDLKIEFNGLAISRRKMDEFAEMIRENGLRKTIQSLERTHKIDWDEL